MNEIIYLGLGSSEGDREQSLWLAVEHLKQAGLHNVRVSSLYDTRPFGGVEQPDYLNAVVEGETQLYPRDLYRACKEIEVAMGRDIAAPRNSSRPIDIDLLLYGSKKFSSEGLQVPHAGLRTRDFVLAPLLELNPTLVDPESGTLLVQDLIAIPQKERYVKKCCGRSAAWLTYEQLVLMGEDPTREGLVETPRRVERAWQEMLRGRQENPADFLKLFEVPEAASGSLVIGPIFFASQCEHHLLPFWGEAYVAIRPKGKVYGLSKFSRVVRSLAAKLHVQERLTEEVAGVLAEHNPECLGVAVMTTAQHGCICSRGVFDPISRTTTLAWRGVYGEDQQAQAQFLQLVSLQKGGSA